MKSPFPRCSHFIVHSRSQLKGSGDLDGASHSSAFRDFEWLGSLANRSSSLVQGPNCNDDNQNDGNKANG